MARHVHCSGCGELNHNKRSCPDLRKNNPIPGPQPAPAPAAPTLDWQVKCLEREALLDAIEAALSTDRVVVKERAARAAEGLGRWSLAGRLWDDAARYATPGERVVSFERKADKARAQAQAQLQAGERGSG